VIRRAQLLLLLGSATALLTYHVACTDDDGDPTDAGGDVDVDMDTDVDIDIDVDVDVDSDSDSDWEEDGDADEDRDADGDAEGDAQTGCGDLPANCCHEECECTVGDRACTYPNGLGRPGVCKTPGEFFCCWDNADCPGGEHCVGALVCGCGEDCTVLDDPGECFPSATACCDAITPCEEGYTCHDSPAGGKCHAILAFPQCWTDEECARGTCVGAVTCGCSDATCVARTGTCTY